MSLEVKAGENSSRVLSESDKLFLSLFTPDEPINAISNVIPYQDFPPEDISFMCEVPRMLVFKPTGTR